MPILDLAIGKSKFKLNCSEGEELKIQNLANKLNNDVNKLSFAVRSADEKTILMLAALNYLEELESKNNNGNSKKNSFSSADNLEEVIKQIRELTKKIENS